MKILKKFWKLFFLVGFIIIICDFNKSNNIIVKSNNGVLNLSQWNFSKDGKAILAGKWDLYYGELLTPKAIKTRIPNRYYNIPGKLNNQINGKTKGYMTLHLKVHVPKDEIYGIYFNSLFTSSDIWVNGVYLDGHGKVGKDANSENAIYRPEYVFFSSINKEVDIVIHTSTYRDFEPGLQSSILGTKQQIMNTLYEKVTMDAFIMGIMFIMGIISFGFYFTKPKKKRNMYFSIICFIMILRCLVLNSRLLVQFYPNMNYEVLSKTAAITFYLSVTFYILFLNDIFENKIFIKNITIVFGAAFTILCAVTNNSVYDRVAIPAQCVVALFILYLCTFFAREIYRNNNIAKKNVIPFIVICITGINDALVNNAVLFKPYFATYGFVFFSVVQSIIMINDYLETHIKLERIHKDGLTSLYNNNYIKQLLSKHISSYNEKDEMFSLLMIDIDDFKSINDTYGHMFGDTVLVDVANVLYETTQDNGYVGRFGGDEFVIILPQTCKEGAVVFARKLMNNIDDLNYKYGLDKKITISIGVYENDTKNISQCINNVDTSMYKAKSLGKNCISSINI